MVAIAIIGFLLALASSCVSLDLKNREFACDTVECGPGLTCSAGTCVNPDQCAGPANCAGFACGEVNDCGQICGDPQDDGCACDQDCTQTSCGDSDPVCGEPCGQACDEGCSQEQCSACDGVAADDCTAFACGSEGTNSCGTSCTTSICDSGCDHCSNGVSDCDETGLDCGGPLCGVCPTVARSVADSDVTNAGTTIGSYVDTQVEDAVSQSITERLDGKDDDKSKLENTWTISSIVGNAPYKLVVVARQNGSLAGDTFDFTYQTDIVSKTVVFTVTAADTAYTRYEAVVDLAGVDSVTIKAKTHSASNNTALDVLDVDFLSIEGI